MNWTEFIKHTCSWRAEYMNIREMIMIYGIKTTKCTVDITK